MGFVASGKLALLRVSDIGASNWGEPGNVIRAEAIIMLDSSTVPNHGFGFQLRSGRDLPAHQGMLDLLRDAFNHGWTVNVEYDAANISKNGLITRLWITK
jgi:hypothetical protein